MADRLLVQAPPPERVGWIGAFTYAHRGLWGRGAPENSLGAFAAAVERGFGIELDARLSRDGVAVVFHDHRLDRMTDERGPVEARSAGELGRVAIVQPISSARPELGRIAAAHPIASIRPELVEGPSFSSIQAPSPKDNDSPSTSSGWTQGEGSGGSEHIPTLRQVIELVAGRVPVLIELKCEHRAEVAPLCAAVRRDIAEYRGRHAVMSFDPRVPAWFARHAADTVRGLSFRASRRDSLLAVIRRRLAFWHARPHFLTCDIAGLPLRLAAHQRARGLPLVAWTIIDAGQRVLAEAHADAVIAEGAGLA